MLNPELWALLADSFWKILLPGLTMTIPLTAISFALAMVIAIAVALVQFANIRVLKLIARFYVWVVRGTPLLVQLFVVFYGLPNVGILIDPFPAAVLVFSLNEGGLLFGDGAGRPGICAAGADGGGAVRGNVLSASDAAHHSAPGFAHRLSLPLQFSHRHGEGHLPGGQYHGDGDVHGDPENCGQNL